MPGAPDASALALARRPACSQQPELVKPPARLLSSATRTGKVLGTARTRRAPELRTCDRFVQHSYIIGTGYTSTGLKLILDRATLHGTGEVTAFPLPSSQPTREMCNGQALGTNTRRLVPARRNLGRRRSGAVWCRARANLPNDRQSRSAARFGGRFVKRIASLSLGPPQPRGASREKGVQPERAADFSPRGVTRVRGSAQAKACG